jgi:tRNA uridine 5-carbamoylmethylation protein Kti12
MNIEKIKKSIKYGKRQNKKPVLIILMGLPGVGKTYLSKFLNKKYSFTVLSGENITYSIFGTEKCLGNQYKEAYETLRSLAIELLKKKYNVVVDGTNLKYEFRKQIYEAVGKLSKTVLIYLYTSDKIAFKRANSRKENYKNLKMIMSKCSPKKFKNFKNQLEMPRNNEIYYPIKSDKKLFENIDKIIKTLV